jgi:hypothetical protein
MLNNEDTMDEQRKHAFLFAGRVEHPQPNNGGCRTLCVFQRVRILASSRL